MADQKYDVVIVGGGPGGIAAAIWCERVALRSVIVEKADIIGGQLSMIHTQIPDFPGLICGSGADLRTHLGNHLKELDIPCLLNAKVEQIIACEYGFAIQTTKGKILGRSIIVATGVARRRFALADSFDGTGISYSASGAIDVFRGQDCAILGGGDGSLENAVRLSKVCPSVHVIARGVTLRARKHFIEEVEAQPNIMVHYRTTIEEIHGQESLDSLVIREGGEEKRLNVQAMLVKIGFSPVSCIGGLDFTCVDGGYIKTSCTQKTSIEGVWAIGDVCTVLDPSLSVAMGQACVAARDIARYFRGES